MNLIMKYFQAEMYLASEYILSMLYIIHITRIISSGSCEFNGKDSDSASVLITNIGFREMLPAILALLI